MVSEAESANHGKIKSEPLPNPQQEDSVKDLPFSSSSRQNSIMSLALDEIQGKYGKSFVTINMAELLNNVWIAAEGGDEPTLSQSNQNHEPTIDNYQYISSPPRPISLSIPSHLGKKTVDEVWFEIQNEQQQRNIATRKYLRREQTIDGEMTLEDFLVKAGVVQEASVLTSQVRTIESTQNEIRNDHNNSLVLEGSIGWQQWGSNFFDQQQLGSNLTENGGTLTYQMVTVQCNEPVGESSNDIGDGAMGSSGGGRKKRGRSPDGPSEEAIKRRHRRMVKNRESAARSRARKQAYTVEMEFELNQLKEENARLKQTVEEVERKRKHEQLMMRRLYTTRAERTAEKLRELRRTVSLHW